MTSRIELLSPARDLACGKAAIDHGADAVYIGAPKFGARVEAGNAVQDIAALAAHAHRFGARVYVTLNTILYDDELEEARKLVQEVYDAGADALIIQDMGLLELGLPPIPLFASTQAHNHDLSRIQFFEQVGFRRVILARELSLPQIKSIRAGTSLELEFFIHGALCVSLSGQCYISHAATGRSANRGECAQLCRLPYTLTDSRGTVLASNQHLLSLRDLNLSEYLADLVDAGVTSFKIEGRLKDLAYVKNVTAFYRARLDALIEGREGMRHASTGSATFSFTPDPGRTFSRGATDYFIRKRNRGIVEVRTPKSLGKDVGTVEQVGSNYIRLRGAAALHNGDGICFFDENDELRGTNVNTVEGDKVFPNSMEGIRAGLKLYRNFDHRFLQALEGETSRRTVGVRLVLRSTESGFTLSAIDEDGVAAQAVIDCEHTIAKKPDSALATMRTQLAKVGGSMFRLDGLEIRLDEPYFLPIGTLNKMRRDSLEALEAERLRRYVRETSVIAPNAVPYPAKELDYSANVVNAMAEQFYRRHGVERIQQGFEKRGSDAGVALMTTRHCLKFQFDLCRGNEATAGDLFLSDGTRRYRLEFDCDRCVMKVVAS